MGKKEALELVLALAVENIIDDESAKMNGLEDEQVRQEEAAVIVRTMIEDMSWKF